MIWFIAALAITLVFVTVEYQSCRDAWSALGAFLCGVFFGGMLAILIALGVGSFVYDEDTYTYTFPVVAAQDGSNVQGRFSIFGGYIEEVPYYFFYRERPDGGIYQGKIKANSTLIYEDQETQNYIKVTKCHERLAFWGVTPNCDPSYEIHVPEGSVKRDVTFDLE